MTFVNKNSTDWDKYIGLLMAAYRSTPHPATGFSPNFLMFGREGHLPSHIMFPVPQTSPVETGEYAKQLREQMEDTYYLAREHLKRNANRQKRDYDTRLSEKKI